MSVENAQLSSLENTPYFLHKEMSVGDAQVSEEHSTYFSHEEMSIVDA